jgi:polyhydroxyalkanoate synthase
MDDIAIEDYMRLGPLEASDAIREITGQATVNVICATPIWKTT